MTERPGKLPHAEFPGLFSPYLQARLRDQMVESGMPLPEIDPEKWMGIVRSAGALILINDLCSDITSSHFVMTPTPSTSIFEVQLGRMINRSSGGVIFYPQEALQLRA